MSGLLNFRAPYIEVVLNATFFFQVAFWAKADAPLGTQQTENMLHKLELSISTMCYLLNTL